MEKFPFFQWYPADAEMDSRYRMLTWEERGVFHTLLNLAWMNDGLPADIGGIAGLLREPPEFVTRVWARLEPMFHVGDDGLMRNRRQEVQRAEIHESQKNASEAGKRGAKARAEKAAAQKVKDGTPKPPLSDPTRVVEATLKRPLSDPSTRAYDSDSDSASGFSSGGMQGGALTIPPADSVRYALASGRIGRADDAFEAWWAFWSASRGTLHRTLAEQAFLENVPPPVFLACMECTSSYLDALTDIEGYRPDNFLRVHAEGGFSKRYGSPAAKPARRDSIGEMVEFKRKELERKAR